MTKKRSQNESGFTRLLGWTVLLSLVFSAGMITGQRLLRHESVPPLVSLSSEAQASSDAEAEAARVPLKTTFSFYEHLSNSDDETDETELAIAADETIVEEEAEAEESGAFEPEQPEEKNRQDVTVVEKTPEAREDHEAESREDVMSGAEKSDGAEIASVKEVESKGAESLVGRVADMIGGRDDTNDAAEGEAASFTIQVGNHSSKAAAVRELSRLRAMKIDAHMITVEVGDKRLYRVRVGKFSNDTTAHADLEKLGERKIRGMVVPL